MFSSFLPLYILKDFDDGEIERFQVSRFNKTNRLWFTIVMIKDQMDFPSDFSLLYMFPILCLSFYETLCCYIKHMGNVCKNVNKKKKRKGRRNMKII